MATYIKPEAIKDSSLPIEKIDNVALDLADKVNALDDSNKALFLNKINAMPATPSGDPMHWAYVAAGAEYNDTGADIVKDTPWADLIDDDYTGEYGKTVIHKAGYWYLNGLGDMTNDEMRKIYTRGNVTFTNNNTLSVWKNDQNIDIRTNLNYNGGSQEVLNGYRCAQGNNILKVMLLCNNTLANKSIVCRVPDIFALIYCVHILGVFANNESISFGLAHYLETLRLCPFYNVRLNDSSNLSVKSVLYMINNEAATSPITITLHKTVYDRCMANDTIKAALETHTNVSLASA